MYIHKKDLTKVIFIVNSTIVPSVKIVIAVTEKGKKMELNREQIIKALECCTGEGGKCENCPRLGFLPCTKPLMKDALALINSQEQDKEKLGLLIDELEKEKRELFEENKRLTEENERLRERNITLEQKLMLLGIDDVYVFKAKEMLDNG